MPIRPEDFPQWLAGRATRRIDAQTHRAGIVQMMDWLIGPQASATIRARAAASAIGRPAAQSTPSRHDAELAAA